MVQRAEKKTGKRSQAVSAKRQAILTAALNIFSQYGIHGTRLEQVAEQAGVSKTNLLYYYPSKEVLYIAVLRQILDIWLAPLKAFREDFAPLVARLPSGITAVLYGDAGRSAFIDGRIGGGSQNAN